jgi:LEA14-like dessication related protein
MCESLPLAERMKDPVLSLNSMELTGINFTGVDMLCKVNVENPNPVEIPFPHIEWDVFVASNELVNGTIETGEKLKARKSTIVNVPFHVDYADLYNTSVSVKDASKSGAKETDFKVALAAKFNLPFLGEKSLSFEIDGKIPLLQMLKFSGASISIDKIDFSGISLNCLMNVENPNFFEIPFPEMDWDYSVNKNSFIKSSVAAGAGSVGANSVVPVNIKLDVDYTELYKTFQSLFTVGEADGVLALTSGLSEVPAFAGEEQSLEVTNKIPLLKPPVIRFTGITVRNVNIFEGLLAGNSKIDLTIGFEVENKNTFAVNFDSFAYKLTVNGSQWADGAVPGETVVKPNSKTTIPVTLSINTLSLVKEIGALVASRKTNVPYTCEGGVSISADFTGLKPVVLPFNLSGVTKF